MELRDPSLYNEASYNPFDHEETHKEAYREASEKMMIVLNNLIIFLHDHGYAKSKTLWGVIYAIGHPLSCGLSMREKALELGCTKQAISKHTCDFLRATGLPPSPALKSEDARKTYKKTNGKGNTNKSKKG